MLPNVFMLYLRTTPLCHNLRLCDGTPIMTHNETNCKQDARCRPVTMRGWPRSCVSHDSTRYVSCHASQSLVLSDSRSGICYQLYNKATVWAVLIFYPWFSCPESFSICYISTVQDSEILSPHIKILFFAQHENTIVLSQKMECFLPYRWCYLWMGYQDSVSTW